MLSYLCFVRRRLSKCAARRFGSHFCFDVDKSNQITTSQWTTEQPIAKSVVKLTNGVKYLHNCERSGNKALLLTENGFMRRIMKIGNSSCTLVAVKQCARGSIKKRQKHNTIYPKIPWDFSQLFFFFFFFFFPVPQLYLWGSPLLGEIFAYVTVFLIQPLR